MTIVMLFTRDLRVHDHPALCAAAEEGDRVVPLFVFDDAVYAMPLGAPNKVAFLLDAVADLTSACRGLGGALVKRHGALVEEVAAVVEEASAEAVFLSEDVSAFATRRLEALRSRLGDAVEVRTFPGLFVHGPGEIESSSGGAYHVFTPYHERWADAPRREVLDPPSSLTVSSSPRVGSTPSLHDLVDGEPASDLLRGGETEGRRRLDAWSDEPVKAYAEERDDLAHDATSRLSAYLHLGCISPLEVVERIGRHSTGAQAFVRQVCWRDYYAQVHAAHPEKAWEDYRDLGDDWSRGGDDFDAWCAGRTGYPLVDAAMRQLLAEGWMHNRARLLVASFLTRDLYVDWRAGARHFLEHLVDGDLASNNWNWQRQAGTGTIAQKNRVYSPARQAEQFDPDGTYVRRYVPELRSIEGSAVHEPWELDADVRAGLEYPERIVEHEEAVAAFKERRGA